MFWTEVVPVLSAADVPLGNFLFLFFFQIVIQIKKATEKRHMCVLQSRSRLRFILARELENRDPTSFLTLPPTEPLAIVYVLTKKVTGGLFLLPNLFQCVCFTYTYLSVIKSEVQKK